MNKSDLIKQKLSFLGIKTKRSTWQIIFELSDKPKEEWQDSWGVVKIEPLIEDILKIDIEKHPNYDFNDQFMITVLLNENRTASKTFHKIRDKLIDLGFTAKDSPFLFLGTKEYHAEKIKVKSKVTHNEALRHVEIAQKMGWINVLK